MSVTVHPLSEEMNAAVMTGMARRSDESLRLSSNQPRLSILLLCDDHRGHADTVLDHIAGIRDLSSHDVRTFNPRGLPGCKSLDLNEFDVVVIHYSLFVVSDHYLSPSFREKLRRFPGLKVQLIQDEHRWVNDMTAMIRYLGIHVLFTLLPTTEIPKVYDEVRLPGLVKVPTLGGYVPDRLVGLEVRPSGLRPIDIGYRGRTLPFWLGRLAQEKVWVGKGVIMRAKKYGLRCDICWAEGERIYGKRWTEFLASCKATLGTESGASITDFDGSIEKRTKNYLAEHPNADFHEVYGALLEPYEGNVRFNVLSPRIFEAAALRTALILFPGNYSGVIRPWVHYIPLEKDFSNMDEVVEKLRDSCFLRSITDAAYTDLVASGRYSYRAFVRDFDAVVARYGRESGCYRKVWYRVSGLERRLIIVAMQVWAAEQSAVRFVKMILLGGAVCKLIMATRGGRRILLRCLADGGRQRASRVRQVLRDVLRLAVVGQARTGVRAEKGQFYVSVRFDRDQGQLVFISHPLNEMDSDAVAKVRSSGNASRREVWWEEFASAVREGGLRYMVWNHAAIGGGVRYSSTSSRGLAVTVGEHDLHHFHGLVELSRLFPEETWDLLSSILSVGQGSPRALRRG